MFDVSETMVQLQDNETALYTASYKGFVDIVQALTEAGANPNLSGKVCQNAYCDDHIVVCVVRSSSVACGRPGGSR